MSKILVPIPECKEENFGYIEKSDQESETTEGEFEIYLKAHTQAKEIMKKSVLKKIIKERK